MNIDDLRGKKIYLSIYGHSFLMYYAGILNLDIVGESKYADLIIDHNTIAKIILEELKMPFNEFCHRLDNNLINNADYDRIPSESFVRIHRHDDFSYKKYEICRAVRNNQIDDYSTYYINKFLKHYKLKRKNEPKHTN